VLAAVFAFNEGDKIRRTIARHPAVREYDLFVVDAVPPTDRSTSCRLASNSSGMRRTAVSVRR